MPQTQQHKAAAQNRQRYCDLRATDLAGILATCHRHLSNINKTHLDLLDCEDGTPEDDFYIKMILGMWQDMRDDVQAIIEAQLVAGQVA